MWPILWPGRGPFPVQVELHVGKRARGLPVGLARGPEVTEQVRHDGRPELVGRAERQTAHGAELLLELARHAGLDRQVAGVLRARRHLVDEHPPVARDEAPDAEDAHEIELRGHGLGENDRLLGDPRRHAGGRLRERVGNIKALLDRRARAPSGGQPPLSGQRAGSVAGPDASLSG